MKSLPKASPSSRGKFLGPRFRILPELVAGARLRVEMEIPSDLKFVGPVAAYFSRLAREHNFPEKVWAENLPLTLDEAVTNAIRHGNGLDAAKTVRLDCRLSDGELEISVEDEGSGFDPDLLPDPREGDSLYRTSGRGVFLIRKLCHDVRYEADGSRAVLIYRSESD